MRLFTSFKLLAALIVVASVVIFSSCHKNNIVQPVPIENCCDGLIKLSVKDSTGKAINEVKVNLYKKDTLLSSVYTNGDGNYSFTGICTGNYSISLNKSGYKELGFEFAAACSDSLKFNKILVLSQGQTDTCCNGTAKITVTDSKGNKLAASGNIRKNGASIGTFTTNNDGVYNLTKLCPGNYSVLMSKDGYKNLEVNFTETCNDAYDFTKVMDNNQTDTCCNGTAKFALTDKNGNKLANVSGNIRKNGTSIGTFTTDANGVYTITKLCAGSYSILFTKDGYKSLEVNFTETCNDAYDYTKVMENNQTDTCCNGVAKISVTDSKGNKLVVSGNIRKNGTSIGTFTTNNDGVYTLTKLCEGSYSVVLSKDGYKSLEVNFTETCNDTFNLSKVLELNQTDTCCNGTAKFALTDKNGNKLANVSGNIRKNGTSIGTFTTDANGVYTITKLCAGSYSILFTKDGYKSLEVNFTETCNDAFDFSKVLEQNQTDTCCNGTAKITITDSQGNKLAFNGNIRKNGTSIGTFVSTNGIYTITKLCPGTYSVLITKDGYKSIEVNFTETCNDAFDFSKVLEQNQTDTCCNGTAKITITDSQGNKLAFNGNIRKNGTSIGTFVSTNGIYTITKLCPGTYSVLITKDGYKSIEVNFTETCNDAFDFSKVLEQNQTDTCCNGTAKFTLTDSKGNKLANVSGNIRKSGTSIGTFTTNSDGTYTITKLCKGDYSILFTKDGYKSLEVNFTETCNDNYEYTKVMENNQTDTCCKGILRIKITNDGGDALGSVSINLTLNGVSKRTGTTEASGYITFKELCTGTYVIHGSKDGYNGIEYSVTISCNDSVNVSQKMTQKAVDSCCTAILKIRAVDDSTSAYINDARVEIYKDGNMVADGNTSGEGWFTKEQLCAPATYTVKVIKDGYVTRDFTFTYTLPCSTKQETSRMKKQ